MNFGESVFTILFLAAWVGGLAVAKGFWLTLACLIPPVAWVVLAQHLLEGTLCR